MKTFVYYVLFISICVVHSMAETPLVPRHLGMAHAAHPRTGYRRPNQKSIAFSAQSHGHGRNINIPQQLVECANRQCGVSKYYPIMQILQQNFMHAAKLY